MSDSEDSIINFGLETSKMPNCSVLPSSDSDTGSLDSLPAEVLNKVPRKKYRFHQRCFLKKIKSMRNSEFKNLFRMKRRTFQSLLDSVWFKFPKLGLSPNKKSLNPRFKFNLVAFQNRRYN